VVPRATTIGWLSLALVALAREPIAAAEPPTEAESIATLDLGAGLAIADHRGTVGQVEGTAVALAYGLDASLSVRRGIHRFSLELGDAAGLSFTPVDGVATKMIDTLRVGASYEVRPSRFVGAFVESEAWAPVFVSDEVRSSLATFEITRVDGTTDFVIDRKLRLTDPFRPLSVRQSLGARVRPVSTTAFALAVDAGLGAGEVWASGQRTLIDDERSTLVEVLELASSAAVGPEIAIGAHGKIDGRRLVYGVEYRARLPFASTDTLRTRSLSAPERTEVSLVTGASIEFLPWLTLDYGFTLRRRPLLTPRIELDTTLVLAVRPTGSGVTWLLSGPAHR
jgi:hypothetical protein